MPTTTTTKGAAIPVRPTPQMRRQLDELIEAGFGNTTEVIRLAVHQMHKQEIKMNACEVYHWMGAGWYAPRQEHGDIVYYWCGDNRNREPDTYPMGLGTPEWFDEQPVSDTVVVRLPIK
jgi:hypothetical protein